MANGFFKRISLEEKEHDRFSIRPVSAPKKQSFAAVRRIPDFRIVEMGADPPPESTQSEAFTQTEAFNASQHISIYKPKQLAAALTIIAAATVFMLLICWLISLAMK